MSHYNFLLFVFFLFRLPFIFCQQQSVTPTPVINGEYINPAFVADVFSMEDFKLKYQVGINTQTVGTISFPQTYSTSLNYLHGKSSKKPTRLILGGNILHDIFGPSSSTTVIGRIGVLLGHPEKINRFSEFGGSVAFNLGFTQKRIKISEITFIENGNSFMPDDLIFDMAFSAGFYCYRRVESSSLNRNIFYLGGSIQRVHRRSHSIIENNIPFGLEYLPHYNFLAGWNFQLRAAEIPHNISIWGTYVEGIPLFLNINYKFPIAIWGNVSGSSSYRPFNSIGVAFSTNNFSCIGPSDRPCSIFYQLGIDYASINTNAKKRNFRTTITYQHYFREVNILGPTIEFSFFYLFKPYRKPNSTN